MLAMTPRYVPPVVVLTAAEEKLFGEIAFGQSSHEQLQASCLASGKLAASLLAREAIPEVRTRYFTEPDCNPGYRKSRQQVFESNGTAGDDILSHGNFLKYLRYFILGPDLPADAMAAFTEIACASLGIDGEDVQDLQAAAKASVREHRLDPHYAAEEYFKLALECGVSSSYATLIRSSIRVLKPTVR
jgi:hypothetical protein